MNILITGLNSYLGNSFKNYLASWPNVYNTKIIDLRKNLNDYNSYLDARNFDNNVTDNNSMFISNGFSNDCSSKTQQKIITNI